MTAPLSTRDLWDDRNEQLGMLPDAALFDLARNEAAEHRYRLFAVEILMGRKSKRILHPELRGLVHELNIELEGIQFEYPAPSSSPMVASVTTETLYGPEFAPESQEESVQEMDETPKEPDASEPA